MTTRACRVCGPVCKRTKHHQSSACRSGDMCGGCTGYTDGHSTFICDCPCHDDRFGCPCEVEA